MALLNKNPSKKNSNFLDSIRRRTLKKRLRICGRVVKAKTETMKLKESLLDKEDDPKNVIENPREIDIVLLEKIKELSKVNESFVMVIHKKKTYR